MSQKTGNTIIVLIVIILNIWLMSTGGYGGGRGTDYYEGQYEITD